MKFLMTYQGDDRTPPTPAKMAEIGAFTERYVKSGVVVLTGGIVRATHGLHLKCEGGKVRVTDGPFAETKELIDGFALVEVADLEEAKRVASEFMQVAGDGTSEILPIYTEGL